MDARERMQAIDAQLAHVWMVRTFVKHSEEAEEDDELSEIPRGLYDYVLALGSAWKAQDADEYLRVASKKFAKLRRTTEAFAKLQPQVSTHTNFQMAVRSLNAAVAEVGRLLEVAGSTHNDE